MYKDLINAGNDLILDFKITAVFLNEILRYLEREVKKGRIDEKKIDESVKRILRIKGYKVKS